jgi:hypothetical protein
VVWGGQPSAPKKTNWWSAELRSPRPYRYVGLPPPKRLRSTDPPSPPPLPTPRTTECLIREQQEAQSEW